MEQPERISVYVDGFNVYYGFKRKGWERYLWLDYRAVFERMVRPGQELVTVNYFSALSNREGSRQRQQTYLNALDVRGGLTVHMGRIESRPIKCKKAWLMRSLSSTGMSGFSHAACGHDATDWKYSVASACSLNSSKLPTRASSTWRTSSGAAKKNSFREFILFKARSAKW